MKVNYPDSLNELAKQDTYIGMGNPSSPILLVGKEVATDQNSSNILERQNLYNHYLNSEYWLKNKRINLQPNDIKKWTCDNPKGENNPLFAFKGALIKEEGKTWRKYQKLHDYIFKTEPKNEIPKYEHNFQLNMFLTEMSVAPAKRTDEAQKRKMFKQDLKYRKENFFKSKFIQTFPIVVLACSNYINGKEIEEIFNVKFKEQKGIGKQLFWTHYNENRTKLVIHTRQLSANVSNLLLEEIGNEIKEFLYCAQKPST